MNLDLGYLILAAGKGTRMHSDLPKVLQHVMHKPMLGYVFDSLNASGMHARWTVVGFGADAVRSAFPDETNFVLQEEQLGTGHAVVKAWQNVVESGVRYVCVLNGDTPHVPVDDIVEMACQCRMAGAAMGFLTLQLENPFGYGRVVRSENGLVRNVVEEKDFHPNDFGGQIHEVNSGVYVLAVEACSALLPKIDRNNAQNEFYLTQLISLCAAEGLPVVARPYSGRGRLLGINSPRELVEFEESLRGRIVNELLDSGVIIRKPGAVIVGPDVIIEPGVDITGPCEIYGKTHVQRGAQIASHCWIKDSFLGPCQVKSFSHIEASRIGAGASVGPFARLRPGTDIGERARVGNFVEVKKSTLHAGAKAGHLSYLGDSEIGRDVNIGAGTITCNYDGSRKHRTEIQENAFIGSNTALVAPVVVGAGALVGAGSVVTKNVPAGALCVARARQLNLERKSSNQSHSGE